MRYRLDVVAYSVPEVVKFAGGWLVDRVMAGWAVTVLIPADEDTRPLEILGVQTFDLESALEMGADRPHPQTVAVASVSSLATCGYVRACSTRSTTD